MERKIGVIFDMDGVLVENSDVHEATWLMMFKKFGKDISKEEVRGIFGATNKTFIERFLGITDEKRINEIAEEKEALYRENFAKSIKAPEGLMTLLFTLKKNNVRMAVTTSAPRANLNFVLDALDIRSFFDVLVDETFVKHAKPNPEIYTVTASKLNIEAESCIVIEDSIFGIQAGLAAGMKVIGITTTLPEDKINFADHIIHSFNEIGFEQIEQLLMTND